MKHEESVDVRRVSNIAKIDTHNKLIQLNKSDIGIKTWGRIDYLCNILGYRLVKNGIVVSDSFSDETKVHNREIKKHIKADKANNNMKKNTKKKK